MITKKKIKIFDKYAGEFEGLQIIGSAVENKEIDEKEWNLIDSFINDLELINKKLVTESYKNKISLEMSNLVEKEAIALLNEIANN